MSDLSTVSPSAKRALVVIRDPEHVMVRYYSVTCCSIFSAHYV